MVAAMREKKRETGKRLLIGKTETSVVGCDDIWIAMENGLLIYMSESGLVRC